MENTIKIMNFCLKVRSSKEYNQIVQDIISKGADDMHMWSTLPNNTGVAFDYYGDWKTSQGFLLGLKKGIELSAQLNSEENKNGS